jgi:DNA invertase Pin-like site-specific DNA recombinase
MVLSPPLPGIGDRILGPQAVREFWFHAAVTAAGMRSLKHLLALADELCERGVGLVVLKQHIDTTTSAGPLVFHVFAALAEFIRKLIVEGTREGNGRRPRPRRAPRPAPG